MSSLECETTRNILKLIDPTGFGVSEIVDLSFCYHFRCRKPAS